MLIMIWMMDKVQYKAQIRTAKHCFSSLYNYYSLPKVFSVLMKRFLFDAQKSCYGNFLLKEKKTLNLEAVVTKIHPETTHMQQ